MEEKQHPFSRLIDDIVNPQNQAAEVDTETLLTSAKEDVIAWEGYQGESFEQLAYALIRNTLGEKNPTIRVQFVAQVLALVANR